MSSLPSALIKIEPAKAGSQVASKAIQSTRSNELVFAVVGHVGSGTSEVTKMLAKVLTEKQYDVHTLKARDVISKWASSRGKSVPAASGPSSQPLLKEVERLQDLGDEMRAQKLGGVSEHAAVAKGLVRKIRETRATAQNKKFDAKVALEPDGAPRAYVLDSLRHPAEVELLRALYGPAFTVIGVVCEEGRRIARLTAKYDDAGQGAAQRFMERDANATEKHGQHVADTFHKSDFFIDNSEERKDESGQPNKHWDISDQLSRLVKIITRSAIVRPTVEETAMYHAHAAKMRSACLSRQVGAAVLDGRSNIIATGTNEVPKGGGGVYSHGDVHDSRCAYHSDGTYCRNTREQNEIISELIKIVPELDGLGSDRKQEVADLLRKSRIGGLLEFSRAVHAETDAIISAARTGNSLIGARLFVTTFPCHYCARHVVVAGIDEVQFIEPYPKSRALSLHSDSIKVERQNWMPPSKGGTRVLFRPFTGVAPRRYEDAFLKTSELKNQEGNLSIAEPGWLQPWDLIHQSYIQAELEIEEPS